MTTPPGPPADAADTRESPQPWTAGALAAPIEPARPFTACHHVFERFFLDHRLLAIPVVDEDQPIALLGRHRFIETYRHGPCRGEANVPHRIERHSFEPPRTIDESTTVEDLAELFVADAGRECADGIVVTRGGRYLGVIVPHGIVRALIERDGAQAARSVFRDERTGLASASLFADRLAMAVAAADRTRTRVAALVIDLRTTSPDGVARPGSALAAAAAARLDGALRHGDTIARLGEARLGIVLPAIGHLEGARTAGRKLLEALDLPAEVEGAPHLFAPRLGIAVFPDDAASARRLIECAVRAVEQAGEPEAPPDVWTTTSNPVCYGTLRHAIEHQLLTLAYQPQIDLVTGRPCGVEALVRWTEAGGRAVPANRIIELAESAGLMTPLTEWVLRAACEQMRAWHARRVLVVRIAVNVSGAQARRQALPSMVERVLADTGLPPAALEIELSEQALTTHGPALTPVLARLRDIGARVAVDDFGSGALPIRQLPALPIDAVKLDRTLIAAVATDTPSAAIVRSVVTLAHGLNLQVIAEGVETADQAALLRSAGCDVMQGFHVSPPLGAAALAAFIAAALP